MGTSRQQDSALEQQLRWLLPRRGPVSAPLATLLDPAQRVNILSLLGGARGELAGLEKSLHTLESLAVATQLKAAVALSGLFSEADLRRMLRDSPAAHERDLRSLLQALLGRVDERAARSGNAPEQVLLAGLRTQLEGALATLALQQLSAAARRTGRAEDGRGTTWLMAIPFKWAGVVSDLELAIEQRDRPRGQSGAEDDGWRVNLRLSLPGLGPLEAELSLQGRVVAVVLYAQLPAALDVLHSRSPLLQMALERCGLQVSVLRCLLGTARSHAPRLQPGLDCTA